MELLAYEMMEEVFMWNKFEFYLEFVYNNNISWFNVVLNSSYRWVS